MGPQTTRLTGRIFIGNGAQMQMEDTQGFNILNSNHNCSKLLPCSLDIIAESRGRIHEQMCACSHTYIHTHDIAPSVEA